MNRKIIWAGLRARPVRTAVTMLAVAMEVTLILVIAGMATGMLADNARRVAGVGGDIMVKGGKSVILTLGGVMPAKLGPKLAQLPEVKLVAPVLIQTNNAAGLEQVWGIDPATFNTIGGGLRYVQGQVFSAPDEIVVDDVYAKSKKVNVGDHVEVLNRQMKVSGIFEHGIGARIAMSLPVAQEMSGQLNQISVFFLKLTSPDETDAVAARLTTDLPNYGVIKVVELVTLMGPDTLPVLREFLGAVVLVAVCVGVLVIFLSMYTSITERTREIGVLRSLGASKQIIVTLVVLESMALCAVGAVAGVVLSIAVSRGILLAYPTLAVEFTPTWLVRAVVLAMLSGVIGALYPSYRAARQDPIEALAYE